MNLNIKFGDNGKLFGSITEKEIADKINSVYGININKKKIIIKNSIKEIGSYEVNVKLYEGSNCKRKNSCSKIVGVTWKRK